MMWDRWSLMASMPISCAGVEAWQRRITAMQRETYREVCARFGWDSMRAALGWSGTGRVSLATSIVDRHVGRDVPALICIGKDGTERRVSYRELSEASSRFANMLQR